MSLSIIFFFHFAIKKSIFFIILKIFHTRKYYCSPLLITLFWKIFKYIVCQQTEKSYVSIALLVSLDYLVGVPKFPTSLVNLIYKVRGRHENCPPQTIYLYCIFIISFLFIFVKNFFVSTELKVVIRRFKNEK